MAYDSSIGLIRLGGSTGTSLPMKYIKLDGYNITPNQRMESEAKRSVTGVLHRTTVSHTATKIEFTTPTLTNTELNDMMTLIKNNWTSTAERKITLYYYDMETDTYQTGDFYMPDINYKIDHIDTKLGLVYYKDIRIAFIEY